LFLASAAVSGPVPDVLDGVGSRKDEPGIKATDFVAGQRDQPVIAGAGAPFAASVAQVTTRNAAAAMARVMCSAGLVDVVGEALGELVEELTEVGVVPAGLGTLWIDHRQRPPSLSTGPRHGRLTMSSDRSHSFVAASGSSAHCLTPWLLLNRSASLATV